MSISKIRSILYDTARTLGDVQAIDKAVTTESIIPVEKRIIRRLAGKVTGRLIGGLIAVLFR